MNCLKDLFPRPELLAPVGDFERLEAAIRYGADAVYLGSTEFGMRAASANFDIPALREAVGYAHERGVRLYLTCNTLPRNSEIDRMADFIREAGDAGVDAFIVSDIGVLKLVKRTLPDAEIHISTQTGVVNFLTACELYEMGAKRVVLARELSLDEIIEIRRRTPADLEIECFVHGAMCMSFSGRCVLSNYMTDRDANRGQCAQPCRWKYTLMEEKRPGQYFPVFEDETGTYILNAKDLCMLEHIDKLTKAGITSFKIEGRAKSSYYVATVINAYRIAMDDFFAHPDDWKLEPWLLDEVRKVSHRDYSTGFYFGRPDQGQRYENGGYIRNCDIVALVEGSDGGRIWCEQKNKFTEGDELELLQPGKKPVVITARGLQNMDGESIPDTRKAAEPFSMEAPEGITPVKGSILRKNITP
ncbi:MAG: U32 family peptidase [Oscillospiraceae bacterium]|nr:U32 family peptidase [Oscillospiraceae bacterium]